ncbi:hypothetical protein [Streptomyces sp. NPDC058583]|uniref:hypothetical protein n=1 Tax=unclassified Streptomyces TaxID=2593676 RepID=UPI00364CC2B7
MRLPEQPDTGRRLVWVIGQCWRCDGSGISVMWLGPVHSEDHGSGPFYACEPCIQRLEALVGEYGARRDT